MPATRIRRGASSWVVLFGKYLEVKPYSRLVWMNDESDEGAVTTFTFEETGGKTLLVLHELNPSTEALDNRYAVARPALRDHQAGVGVSGRWRPRASRWSDGRGNR